MAGVNFSDNEAEHLLTLVDSKSPKEVHFSKLKRRKSGQDAILRLLKDPLIAEGNVKLSVIHKPFMVTSKIVDILIEHMAYEEGIDLYKNGGNLALSNMLYFCLPSLCEPSLVQDMYRKFIEMIRQREGASIYAFYNAVLELRSNCTNGDFQRSIDLIGATVQYVDDALESVDRFALDPLIPALFVQYVEWGNDYPEGFDAIHDESKTLSENKEVFKDLMSKASEAMEVGYDRRKFELPLRGRSLSFATSHTHPQLQVADVMASAVSYWADGVFRGEEDDDFFVELDKLNLRKLIVSSIWPSADVTPEALGTVHDGGVSAADGAAIFLSEGRIESE